MLFKIRVPRVNGVFGTGSSIEGTLLEDVTILDEVYPLGIPIRAINASSLIGDLNQNTSDEYVDVELDGSRHVAAIVGEGRAIELREWVEV